MWEIKVWDPACNLVLLVLMQVELSKTESGIREYLFVSDRLQQMVILLRQEDLVPYQHFESFPHPPPHPWCGVIVGQTLQAAKWISLL